jgi:putative mRNA 3-end processing factor
MLIEFTDKGMYCRQGEFYVDPWKPVDAAVITHAHSDHARYGSKSYLAHIHTIPILRLRLGENNFQGVEWNEPVYRNGVKISLHPAGHIIGSSQVRIEYKDEIWVISGDYKTENDGISGAFEPVPCHNFVTESTFGLPIYNWKPQEKIYDDIRNWITKNHEEKFTSILYAYSLGKSQRVIQAAAATGLPIYVHGAVWNVQEVLVNDGWQFPAVRRITKETPREEIKGNIVVAPGSADQTPWIRSFAPYKKAICSGWMQVRGNFRRRNTDAGFALSDHADWNGLLSAIKAVNPEKVYVTHGFQSAFSRYLTENGLPAEEITTEFGAEEETAPLIENNADAGTTE